MILPPSPVDTKNVPTMEATMEMAPSDQRDRAPRCSPMSTITRPPSSMVATSVTA